MGELHQEKESPMNARATQRNAILVALLVLGAVMLVVSFAFVDVKVELMTSLAEYDELEVDDVTSIRQRIKELESSFIRILDTAENAKPDESAASERDIDRISLALNALYEQLETYRQQQQGPNDTSEQ